MEKILESLRELWQKVSEAWEKLSKFVEDLLESSAKSLAKLERAYGTPGKNYPPLRKNAQVLTYRPGIVLIR